MIHSVHFIQQYSPIIIDLYGRRYVARAYGARRPDDLWDGWFVFFPLDGARPLATDRETTQSNLGAIRYWASGITSVYLHGALDRARAHSSGSEPARPGRRCGPKPATPRRRPGGARRRPERRRGANDRGHGSPCASPATRTRTRRASPGRYASGRSSISTAASDAS